MIEGRYVEDLVRMFRERDVRLFHACQLTDFESYLEVGGVPSRNLLERTGAAYTRFETDARDRGNRVWDKVFLNLQDFGLTFEKASHKGEANSVPNPYGPVLLVLEPDALLPATDIAISLVSAGSIGFDRGREALSLGDVPRLFWKSTGRAIKFANGLAEEFGRELKEVSNPEMSCTFPEGRIPWHHVKLVRVDRYEFGGVSLRDRVDDLVAQAQLGLGVYERSGGALYDDLGVALSGGYRELQELVGDPACSERLREWAGEIQARGQRLGRQWRRYAGYLVQGTIRRLQGK